MSCLFSRSRSRSRSRSTSDPPPHYPPRHGKADLTIYREGGLEVLDILKEFNPSGAIEKASVDESYADMTEIAWACIMKCASEGVAGHERLAKLIEECRGNTHVSREEQDEREKKAIAVSRDEQRLGHSGQNSKANSVGGGGVKISPGSQSWWDRPLPKLDRRVERSSPQAAGPGCCELRRTPPSPPPPRPPPHPPPPTPPLQPALTLCSLENLTTLSSFARLGRDHRRALPRGSGLDPLALSEGGARADWL